MSDEYQTERGRVLDIVREVGVQRLSYFDGCACGGFTLRNVKVDISCGKGRDRGVWVSHRGDDHSPDDILAIADEVASQVEECDGRGAMPRYPHEWRRPDEPPPQAPITLLFDDTAAAAVEEEWERKFYQAATRRPGDA